MTEEHIADPGDVDLPPLYFACMRNDVAGVRSLLEQGADPNDGESVYHAAEEGHLECLDLLLAHRADISNRHPQWHNTPLCFLAGHTDDQGGAAPWVKGFRWLLEHGADPNVTSYELGETPLHRLVASPRATVATVLLLDHGADVNLPRADGRTPYALALRAGNEIGIALLTSRGARVDTVTPIDALFGACARGDAAEAMRLAVAHPDWRTTVTADDRGIAAQWMFADNAAAVLLLAQLGFDLSWEGTWGGTPLHFAAWLGKPELVRLLIALGAPVNARDARFASSPIAWAAHGSTNCRTAEDDYAAVVDRLLDAGAAWAPAINRSNEPPTDFASPAVAARFAARGFTKPATPG